MSKKSQKELRDIFEELSQRAANYEFTTLQDSTEYGQLLIKMGKTILLISGCENSNDF